jgi:hypothetical protein
VTAAATTGETRIAKPAFAANFHYRLLGLFVDETEAGEIYMGRYFPYAKITERGEQTMSDGDDPVNYSLTFRAEPDPGYRHRCRVDLRWPGWLDLLSDMSITQAP